MNIYDSLLFVLKNELVFQEYVVFFGKSIFIFFYFRGNRENFERLYFLKNNYNKGFLHSFFVQASCVFFALHFERFNFSHSEHNPFSYQCCCLAGVLFELN